MRRKELTERSRRNRRSHGKTRSVPAGVQPDFRDHSGAIIRFLALADLADPPILPASRSAGDKVRFAPDSPLEGGGFEPSVPRPASAGANSSRAAGPTPPIKGRFHRRSDEFLESIKKGIETPEKGRNAGEKLIPPGSSRGRGYKKPEDQPHALALTVGKIRPSGEAHRPALTAAGSLGRLGAGG
jgi:hypothetical protein